MLFRSKKLNEERAQLTKAKDIKKKDSEINKLRKELDKLGYVAPKKPTNIFKALPPKQRKELEENIDKTLKSLKSIDEVDKKYKSALAEFGIRVEEDMTTGDKVFVNEKGAIQPPDTVMEALKDLLYKNQSK